jgi:predicted transcriptional regulator YdeE
MQYLLIWFAFIIISLPFSANSHGETDVKTEVIHSKKIAGISVRTINADEMVSEKAKIPQLWDKFYTETLGAKISGSPVYGLYTNYASDMNGEYTVLAGVEVESTDETASNLEVLDITDGKYLVFEGEGPMPQVVFETWGKIWQYFSSEETKHVRAYTSDFELYKSDTKVAIYIAIK